MIRYVGTVLISSRFLRIRHMYGFLLDAFPIDIPELDLNKGHVRKNSKGIATENCIISLEQVPKNDPKPSL